jgi:hypothetical protein
VIQTQAAADYQPLRKFLGSFATMQYLQSCLSPAIVSGNALSVLDDLLALARHGMGVEVVLRAVCERSASAARHHRER